jgi:hypothetical protein
MEKASIQTVIPNDPAFPVVVEMKRLRARDKTLEELELERSGRKLTGMEKTYIEKEREQLHRREEAAMNYLSAIPASSPAVAAVHLRLALCDLDASPFDDADEHEKNIVNLRLQRLLYSALGILESLVPDDILKELPLDISYCNPWREWQDQIPMELNQANLKAKKIKAA